MLNIQYIKTSFILSAGSTEYALSICIQRCLWLRPFLIFLVFRRLGDERTYLPERERPRLATQGENHRILRTREQPRTEVSGGTKINRAQSWSRCHKQFSE